MTNPCLLKCAFILSMVSVSQCEWPNGFEKQQLHLLTIAWCVCMQKISEQILNTKKYFSYNPPPPQPPREKWPYYSPRGEKDVSQVSLLKKTIKHFLLDLLMFILFKSSYSNKHNIGQSLKKGLWHQTLLQLQLLLYLRLGVSLQVWCWATFPIPQKRVNLGKGSSLGAFF